MKKTKQETIELTIPYNFNPRSYQKEMLEQLDKGVKRVVCVWHRRAGKDATVLNFTIKAMIPHAGNPVGRIGTYYHFFPTFAQGRKILWDGINGAGFKFLDHFPKPLVKNKNENEMRIELINGSIWQIVGTDKLDGIVGTNPVGCVFSEYSIQNPQAWKFVSPILRENKGWAVFIYTPRGRNHGLELFEMASKSDDWFVSHKTVDDTFRDSETESGLPVINKEDILAERKEGMSDELINQEYYVGFEGFQQGSYYTQAFTEADANNRFKEGIYDKTLPVSTAWDLGVGDSTAIIFYQQHRAEIRVIDYFEASGEGLDYYIKVLKQKGYRYDEHLAPHDISVRELSTGRSRFELARKMGINFRVVPKLPLSDGINAVRALIPKCFWDKSGSKELVKCLENYHKKWDDRLKEFKSDPVHDWSSHGADAMRTLALGIRENRQFDRKKPVVKTEFAIFG